MASEQGKDTDQAANIREPPISEGPQHPQPVDAMRAVAIATKFVQSVYGGGSGDVAVEEIDFDQGQGDWLITVGFWRKPPEPSGGLMVLQPPRFERIYKIVRIKQSTGAPISMKIRQIGEP